MNIEKLTSAKTPHQYHDQSGWSSSVLNRDWVSYRSQADPFFRLRNIFTGDEEKGSRAKQGQQFLGPSGGLLDVDPHGEVWESWNGTIRRLTKFPQPKGNGWFRFVPSSSTRMERFVWVEWRSERVGRDGRAQHKWFAGVWDSITNRTVFRPGEFWMPHDVGHIDTDDWHSFHWDGRYAWVIPQRRAGEDYVKRWYKVDPFNHGVADYRDISHPAVAGDKMAYVTWNQDNNRSEVRTNYLLSPIVADEGEQLNHLHLLPVGDRVMMAASVDTRTESNRWTQIYVDVYDGGTRVWRYPVKQLGSEFHTRARPFLGNMKDGVRVFWHSDEENQRGISDLYTTLV